ncbi:MAG: hypothetical protein ACHWZW_05785 [Spirulina sp.]
MLASLSVNQDFGTLHRRTGNPGDPLTAAQTGAEALGSSAFHGRVRSSSIQSKNRG